MARKKLLIAAIAVGLFAGFLVWLYGQQKEEEVEQLTADSKQVVYAAVDISPGTPLTEELITIEEVPQRHLPPNPLMREELSYFLDAPVNDSINQGDMLLTSDFIEAEEVRTLSATVPSGERAMTLPVDAITGVAGLLQPGDRVDILGTFPVGQEDELIPEAGGRDSIGFVTMTMLQNVTLLAVGERISRRGQGQYYHAGYSNVTLSLTPDEAELMIIAQTRGELTLLLRNREDMDTIPVTRRTLREVLEELDVLNRERKERVIRQPRRCPPGEVRNDDGECIPRGPVIHQ